MALNPKTLKSLFSSLAPYADDVAEGIAEYGDDAARLVANYGDDVGRAVDKVDGYIPAFEDPLESFGEFLPYTRQYAPYYWDDVARMSKTTIDPKNSTINVRGKDIHYPMTDDPAGKHKLDKLWDVLQPDEEILMGPNFGPEYSVRSVAMGEDVPGFPLLTRAVRDFEDFGLDDSFGDTGAAIRAYEDYRNNLQRRLNTAASIPKGYVPIDTLHSTGMRPHKNTALYRWFNKSKKLPF